MRTKELKRLISEIEDKHESELTDLDKKLLLEYFIELESYEGDPSPYCDWCHASIAKYCKCGPRAEND